MKSITVIFTCYNRKDKTINAITSIINNNPELGFKFIIVDDSSTDGTVFAIKNLNIEFSLIEGSGHLFWAGGMRKGIQFYLDSDDQNDVLLINDDVNFFPHSIEEMVKLKNNRNDYIVVGATCDSHKNFTYGLRKHRDNKSIFLSPVLPNNVDIIGDTMNANCVLIDSSIIRIVGNFDDIYIHSLADYDYGFKLTRSGYKLISSNDYVGICEENSIKKTWEDTNLKRNQRLKLLFSNKGNPPKQWWYFLRKNYNLFVAIKYSIIPFVKIFLGF